MLALALCACVTAPLPPVEPTYDPATPGACGTFCGRARVLGCSFAAPSPGPDLVLGTDDDSTCERVCATSFSAGLYELDDACLSDSGSCTALDECAAR